MAIRQKRESKKRKGYCMKDQKMWVRIVCWVLAGLMCVGMLTYVIYAILGIF